MIFLSSTARLPIESQHAVTCPLGSLTLPPMYLTPLKGPAPSHQEIRHKHCHISAKNLLIQAVTRIIDYLTYGFIITFPEIPNAFLNESRSVRNTICFKQNIHGYTPGYVKVVMRRSFPHAYHDSSRDTTRLDIEFLTAQTWGQPIKI